MTRAIEALRLLRLPVAPTIIRTRLPYQSVVETGQSTEELAGDAPAAGEMKAFCDYVHRFACASRGGRIVARAEYGEVV